MLFYKYHVSILNAQCCVTFLYFEYMTRYSHIYLAAVNKHEVKETI